MMILFMLTLFILVEVCIAAYDVSFAELTALTSYHSTAICSNGDVVVGGGTTGLIGFPSAGGWDFLVQRFSSTGTLLWSTVWGGTQEDFIKGVSVDDNDNVFVTGYTRSTLAANAVALTVANIGSSGNLIYSHDYGGGTANAHDAPNGISLDSARGVFYVSGYTHSSTFQGLPLNAAIGGFLLKVNCSNGTIIATTLYSRRNYAIVFTAVTTDSTGAAWVVGHTTSPSYSGTASKGDYDIIVHKFSSSGTSLFSTLLGGTSTDGASGVTCDNDGNVYVIGTARLSVDSQTFLGGICDIVVAKYSSDGTKLWTKLVGSAGDDHPAGIAVDSYKGIVYTTGFTRTSSFYTSTSIPTSSTPFFLALHSETGDYAYSQIFPVTGPQSATQAQFRGIASRGEVLYVTGSTQGHILGVTKPGTMGASAGIVAKFGNGTSTIALTRGPTIAPTFMPSIAPTAAPSDAPSCAPTSSPSVDPTADPSVAPTASPTVDPTFAPTAGPTVDPTANPTADPTASPTVDPTFAPTTDPTVDPTANPTADPTASPTVDPTFAPTTDPTVDPTANPTAGPTADPTVDPTVSPTATPSFSPSLVPTASPTRVCLQWALGDYGESCSTTCSKLSRTCKDKYLKDVITQEAFYAVVGSAVNVRSGGAVGATETFCSLTTESVVTVGAPAALSVVLSSEDHNLPVRTSCSYPTSVAEVTAGCDTILPLRNFRRFCPCVDQNCDEGDHAGTWYLGHSGDSCDATCSIAGGFCDAEPLSSVTNAAVFTSVVASTVSLETNNIIGSSSTEFCQQGINVFPFAPAPVVITLNFGAANDTLCSYPTDVSNLQGSCDMAFTDPPAQRFCNCKQTIAPPQSERRALFTPAAPAVNSDPVSVFSAGVSNVTPRLRGKVV